MKVKQFFLSLALLASSSLAYAGTLSLTGTSDKPPVSYQPGEKMVFNIVLKEDGAPVEGKALAWKRTGDDGVEETGRAVSSAMEPLVITTSAGAPGFVRIQVWVKDEAGQDILGENGKPIMFEGGAGVQPEKLQGTPEPADFDAYWAKQKAVLDAVPIQAIEMVPMPSADPNVETWDVKIACAGGKPVSGYFSKTKGAAPKSAIIGVSFMGYGVASAPRQDNQANDPAHPKLLLSINAHGIENGKDEAFYQALKDGALKGYAFNSTENASPETAYFNGMVFRLLRAIEFLKAQPEWNGQTVVVAGGSQGGFQALIAAGLDKSVTECYANIPWCCDLAGPLQGRLKGWRPEWTNALGYFDPANHAKRITCPTFLTTGMGDYICPPSGVSVVYNNLASGTKSITYIQGATHATRPPDPQTEVLKVP